MESYFSNIDPYTFTGSAFLIGLALAVELNSEEQDSIGNWLQLVGLTIQTYGSQQSAIESNNNQQKDNQKDNQKDDIDKITESIEKIEKELDKIKNDRNNNKYTL